MKSSKTRILAGILIVLLALIACAGFAWYGKWRIVAWYLDLPAARHTVKIQKDVQIPMRDGVRLSADIYRPNAEGKFPVILTRTPYGKRNPDHKYAFAGSMFASQGFVYIVQDVRGKFDSEGEFYPYIYEARDGYDTIEWAAIQAWSSGSVGTYGFSYWGTTQWLSAPLGSTHLKAMVPINTSQNPYPRWIYNSIFRLNDMLVWYYENAPKRGRVSKGVDWDKAVRKLPLTEADNALGSDIPAYDDWIRHPLPGPYWDRFRVDDKVALIQAPALIIEGWYDYYLNLAIEDYNRMIRSAGSPEARQSMLLIGPWTHESKSKFTTVDFGKEASFMKQVKMILLWFNYWLKNEQNGILDEGPIRIFTMGANKWRTEKEWPLKQTRYTAYYLHSDGNANSVRGSGLLSESKPETEKADAYTYDPENPVPSIGGTSVYGNLRDQAGPADQKAVETRDDVLVYTTPPLAEDMEVTGPVKLIFYASSSAQDTDFAAKLTEVYPDGISINLQAAVLRARYRDSLERPALLEEGKIYKFEMAIGATGVLFRKGHRIRLQVTSSNFPEYGRNLNTGADNGTTSQTVKAQQSIYHDREHPSHIILPVLPPEKQ